MVRPVIVSVLPIVIYKAISINRIILGPFEPDPKSKIVFHDVVKYRIVTGMKKLYPVEVIAHIIIPYYVIL